MPLEDFRLSSVCTLSVLDCAACRAVSMRDARQQGEWLYIGRIRSDLRDQRLRMTAMTPSTSPSAKVFSRNAVLACDKPRPARHARTDTAGHSRSTVPILPALIVYAALPRRSLQASVAGIESLRYAAGRR